MLAVSLRPELPMPEPLPPPNPAMEAVCIGITAYCVSIPEDEALQFLKALSTIVEEETDAPPPVRLVRGAGEHADARRQALARLRREVPSILQMLGRSAI